MSPAFPFAAVRHVGIDAVTTAERPASTLPAP